MEIPAKYMNLKTSYYKRKCHYCQRENPETVTCLLCDKTMYVYSQKQNKMKISECRVGESQGQNEEEGLMCWHAKSHEGG